MFVNSDFLSFLDSLDRSLFLVLNKNHTPELDTVMWYVSKMWVWMPVYAFLVILVFKKLPWRSFFLFLLFVAMLLFVTDFVSVHAIKSTVMRLRPSHNPELVDQVKMVVDENGNLYRGGKFGFFSNHTSNNFGVAVFFFLVMKPLRRGYSILLFTWVSLIAYSRIYLGVHYPGDIVAGALYGAVAAWVIFRIFAYTNAKMKFIV